MWKESLGEEITVFGFEGLNTFLYRRLIGDNQFFLCLKIFVLQMKSIYNEQVRKRIEYECV